MECNYSMKTKLVGDGCASCNPEKSLEYEIVETPVSLDVAIERAAKHLPDGCFITIVIEKDGYEVILTTPETYDSKSIDGGDGILSDINEAICLANGFTSLC